MVSVSSLLGGLPHGPVENVLISWDNGYHMTVRVRIRDGAILLVEPVWAPRWELPSGEVDLTTQETLAEGARRECWEETGDRFTPQVEPRFVAESFFALHSPGLGGSRSRRSPKITSISPTEARFAACTWSAPGNLADAPCDIPLDWQEARTTRQPILAPMSAERGRYEQLDSSG